MTAMFSCDLNDAATELPHFWEHTVGTGHATLALRADWQAQMKQSMDKDALAKQSAAMQRSMNKAMKDFRELMALEVKTRADTWKLVQQRMQDNMAHLKDMMKTGDK